MSHRISRRDVLATTATTAALLGLSPFLRAAVQRRGTTHVAAERIVQAMVDRGAFGELTYASGGSVEHSRSICRWLGIGRHDRLATLVARPDRGGQHVIIRTARGRLIELRLGSASGQGATTRGKALSLHGLRGACHLGAAGDCVYLHGRTRGDNWEPLSRYEAEFPPALSANVDITTVWREIPDLAAASIAAGSGAVQVPPHLV